MIIDKSISNQEKRVDTKKALIVNEENQTPPTVDEIPSPDNLPEMNNHDNQVDPELKEHREED